MFIKRSLALLLCLAALTTAGQAGTTLDKFKGNYSGNFAFTATGGMTSYSGGGKGQAGFASKSKGKTGTLTLSAADATVTGVTYSTVIKFKAHGKCSASAIAPGVSDAAGAGTWKLKGGKISYSLTGSDSLGSYTLAGTVKAHGGKLQVQGAYTVSTLFPGAPTGGTYSFN